MLPRTWLSPMRATALISGICDETARVSDPNSFPCFGLHLITWTVTLENSLTAQFREGDTAYEWLKNFLVSKRWACAPHILLFLTRVCD